MGGYVPSPRVFKAAARAFVKILRRWQERGVRIKSLSLGGGFPAAIGDEEAFPIEELRDFPDYWDRLLSHNGVQPLQLIFEPGKSITLNAGVGLMRVISRKRLGKSKRMVIADGSSYNFVPDAIIQGGLYEGMRYDVLPASKMNHRRIHGITIAGNTCDQWDIIVRNIDMPKLVAGDLLAVMDVGGYAQVIACNFNTIKRAAAIMIHPDGTMKLVRRRERYSEMFAPELDVLKVAGPNELERYNNLYRVNIDKIWKSTQKDRTRPSNRNGNGNGNGDEDRNHEFAKQTRVTKSR
jgi:diaminopimelate decarboxylase